MIAVVESVITVLEFWPRFSEPWPAPIVIGLLALTALTLIPIKKWASRQNRGLAWSVRHARTSVQTASPDSHPRDGDHSGDATSVAVLAIWNRGEESAGSAEPARATELVLHIDAANPEVKILSVSCLQSNPDPLSVRLRQASDGRGIDLTLQRLAKFQGAIFRIEHTGPWRTELRVTSGHGDAAPAYFAPSSVLPNRLRHKEPWRRPSSVVGVLILLSLAFFWSSIDSFPLTQAFHAALAGLGLSTLISGAIIMSTSITRRRWIRGFIPQFVVIPRELDRFLGE